MAITWVTNSIGSPGANGWTGVAYGGGRFVAVTDGTTSAYSTDGETWSAGGALPAPGGSGWQMLAYGAGVFCAVDNGSAKAATSPDGTTWTERTLPLSEDWSSVVWNSDLSLFIATAFSANKCATSPDGITWTQRDMPATANWMAPVATNGTTLVALSFSSVNGATSTDGTTWSAMTQPNAAFNCLIWVDDLGLFVATVENSAVCYTSPDGTTWTSRTMPSTEYWRLVFWDGAQLVAMTDYETGATATSPDGITWTADTATGEDEGYYGAAISPTGTLVVIGYTSSNVVGYTVLLSEVLSDGLGLADTTTGAMTAVAASALALVTSTTLTEVYALVDTLDLTDTSPAVALRLATLTEAFSLQDSTALIMEATIGDSFSLTDQAIPTRDVLVALTDTLIVTGNATNTIQAFAQISETLAFAEIVRLVSIGEITDDLAFDETIEALMRMYEELVSNLLFEDESRGMADLTVVVEESFGLDDTITPIYALIATITEGLDFAIGFQFEGEPYLGLSMNAATKALSTYTNYPFNSMATFNGRTYGASSEGLYRLGGSTDAGEEIIWKIRTGLSNLGTGRNKSLDAAYIGFTADGRVALKCIIVAPTGEKIAYWQELTGQTAENPLPKRLTFGRGLKSVYMGFELSNIDAGDIELDIIELHPIILDGRL